MKRLIAIVVVVFAVAVAMAGARPKKVKLSETVQYVGEAVKGVPTGEGTIYVNDRPSKEPTVRGDVITGTFDGNEITDAEVVFSSGWRFAGRVVYSAETVTKKPLQTLFEYDLTGTLISPDLRKRFEVTHLIIKRQTDGEDGSLATESMRFNAGRKTLEGDIAEYVVNITVREDYWTSTESLRLGPAVYFKGKDISVMPSGEGMMTVFASDDQTDKKVLETVSGKFSDDKVTGATIAFSSGWKFTGNVVYSVEEAESNPYKVELSYELDGDLFDASDKKITELRSLKVNRTIAPGAIHLKPFENYDSVVPAESTLEKYKTYVKGTDAFYPIIITVEELRDGKWRASTSYPSEVPVIYYRSGHVVKEYGDGFAAQYPGGDVLEIRSSTLVELRKVFPEAGVCLDGNYPNIAYPDTTAYFGSFAIAGVGRGRPVGGYEEAIGRAMDPDTFLDEVELMYIDGLLKHGADTLETWVAGVNAAWEENIPAERRNPFEGKWRETVTQDSKNSLCRWSEIEFAADGTFRMEVFFKGEGSDWDDIRSTGADVIISTVLTGKYQWNGRMMSRAFDEKAPAFEVKVEYSQDCALSDEEKADLEKEMAEGVEQIGPSLEPLLAVYAGNPLRQIVQQNELTFALGLPGVDTETYLRVLPEEQLSELRERREERRNDYREAREECEE